MLRFRTVDSEEPLFETAYKVEKILDKLSDVHIIHPIDGNITVEIKNLILKYCFPLNENRCNYWDRGINVYIISDEGQPVKYLYVRYFQNASKVIAISIISRFLHIRLINKIFDFLNDSNSLNVFASFANAPFKHYCYDVICSSPSPDYVCPYVLSPRSEIASMHQFFLNSFPPYYGAWLIIYLMTNSRVFIISTKTSIITQTITAIFSLFYPISDICDVISLLTSTDMNKIESIKGPCIVGIHSTMFTAVMKSLKKDDVIFNCDEPYLSCENQQKFNKSLFLKITDFHTNMCSTTLCMQPGFPSALILQYLNDFLISFITDTFGIKNKDFNEIVSSVTKAAQSSGSSLETNVAKSRVMKEFISKSDSNDAEFKELFWTEKQLKEPFKKAVELSTGARNMTQSIAANAPTKRSKTFLGFFNK